MVKLMHPLASEFTLEADGPDAFVMLHGWTGSPAHFRIAAEFVHRHGHAVFAPRLEGHGTAVEEMAKTRWHQWVSSALEAVMVAKEHHPRVHLVGLSMGGIISLLVAATNDVTSVTTINAPQRLQSRKAWLTYLYRGSDRIDAGNPSEPPLDEAAEFWVQYAGSPVGTVPDLLLLMRAARRALPRVTAPATIIQSHADETVHPESASILYAGLGSLDKRIVWLERSRHVALLDSERDLIHHHILDQIGRSN